MTSGNESDVAGLVSAGILRNPTKILSLTCYEVERSWRGVNAQMRMLDQVWGTCLWSPSACDSEDDPFNLVGYGNMLTDYRGIRRMVFTKTGRIAAHSYYDNGALTNPCISFVSGARLSCTETMFVQQMLRQEPVLHRHETPGCRAPELIVDMPEDEEDRRVIAAKAGKRLLESGGVDCLMDDPSPEVRALLAGNSFLTAEQAMRLADDPDWHVRRSLCERRMDARKIFMDDNLCRMLGTDPEFEVRVAFAAFMLTAFRNRAGYCRLSWMLDDGPDDELKASLAMMMVAA